MCLQARFAHRLRLPDGCCRSEVMQVILQKSVPCDSLRYSQPSGLDTIEAEMYQFWLIGSGVGFP